MRLPKVCLVAFAVLLLSGPAASLAQADDDRAGMRKEIETAKRQVEELRAKAEYLQAEKRFADARDLVARATRMERAIERALAAYREKHGTSLAVADDRAALMNDVERGVRALRALGHADLAERVVKALRKSQDAPVSADLAGGRRVTERAAADKRRAKAAKKELLAARRQIEVYAIAMKAMGEAERPREMDVLERAVLALKHGSRDDAKSAEIRARGPKREEIIEVLRYAGRLYEEWGHQKRAAQCMKVADELTRGKKAWKPTRVTVRRDRPVDRSRRAEDARLRKIEKRIDALSKAIEKIAAEIDRLRK